MKMPLIYLFLSDSCIKFLQFRKTGIAFLGSFSEVGFLDAIHYRLYFFGLKTPVGYLEDIEVDSSQKFSCLFHAVTFWKSESPEVM